MPERIILIGADKPALNGILAYKRNNPSVSALVLYPEMNPLPEFSCMILDQFMGHGIEFPENLRACGIDADSKEVNVRDNFSGKETTLEYDTLIFASGSAPAQLDVPGEFLGGIFRVGDFEDAARLRGKPGTNVVIGNGMNMLLAVSTLLLDKVDDITVIPHGGSDATEPFSPALNSMIRHHLAEAGVTILKEDTLKRLEGRQKATSVVTDKRTIEAGRIVNAMTNSPVTYLASDAGIKLDNDGHIKVDGAFRTNKTDIYACGSCASFISPSCNRHTPGGAIRNTEKRQALTLAASLAGETMHFQAPICAYSVPLADLTVAGAGLTLETARHCGHNPMSATVIQFDRAHFMPDAELMTLELIFDADTRRVLGIQGLGKSGDALCGRISAVSAILADKPTVEDIANLEIAYSPPFASALDVLNTVGNVAENILAGANEGIDAGEFDRLWQERKSNECFFLDCRELPNAEPFLEKHPVHWNHISQTEIGRRLADVPQDRRIILLCNTGARSYEAQITLKHAGFTDVANVDGGVAAIKQSGIEV